MIQNQPLNAEGTFTEIEKPEMPILFAIIVPVYNTGLYLEEFLRSIACQSYRNFHLYLVDDGSTDNSGTILDDFHKSNPSIKTFLYHTKNQGVSGARNFALDEIWKKNVPYDYVYFCDSDDKLDLDLLDNVAKGVGKDNVDYIVFPIIKFSRNQCSVIRSKSCEIPHHISHHDAVHLIFNCGRKWRNNPSESGAIANKIFKANLALKYRFDTSLRKWEDFKYINTVLNAANKILIVPNAYYWYRRRKSSLSNSLSSEYSFLSVFSLQQNSHCFNSHIRFHLQDQYLKTLLQYIKELYKNQDYDKISNALKLHRSIKLYFPVSLIDLRRIITLRLPRKILNFYLNQRCSSPCKSSDKSDYFE